MLLILQFIGGERSVLFIAGGILLTCIRKTDLDRVLSIEGGRIVPLRQQKGTSPRVVSLVLSRGKSIIVGLLSQLKALEKSKFW